VRAWLFSPRIDVLAFGGSALVSFVLVAVAFATSPVDLARAPAPEWVWIATVLLIDVAHVWGTAILVYLDPAEVRRRPALYGIVPFAALAIGWALASESELWFWRCVAYLAVVHFVRQQVGWVKLYRAKARETDLAGRIVDEGTTYAVTLGPVVWWHAHVPVSFAWMVNGDFVEGAPRIAGDVALLVAAAFFCAYLVRAARAYARGAGQPGKDIVVVTTAALWGAGIVWWANDTAFTLTNVIAHGVPYAVLVVWTARKRIAMGLSASRIAKAGALAIVAALWSFAIVEELLWHHVPSSPLVIAVLAVPQLTHYVLDGFYWRRRDNPALG
jgi:hypothetical protein